MFFLEAGSWIAGFQEDDKGADWGDFRQVRQQWGRQDEQGGVQAAYGIEKELNMTLSDSKHPNISSSHHFIFKIWQSRTKRLAQIRRLQNVYKTCVKCAKMSIFFSKNLLNLCCVLDPTQLTINDNPLSLCRYLSHIYLHFCDFRFIVFVL